MQDARGGWRVAPAGGHAVFTATDQPEAHEATLFVRIPRLLDEEARKAQYDDPLRTRLAAAGIQHVLRGFVLPATLSHPAGVAIEVRFGSLVECFAAMRFLVDVGAPPETLLEVETDTASMQMTLDEAAGD